MKLAILADLHIGYERFEEDSYRQAREALERASGEADAILIAGDIFDKRAPKPEVIAQAINIFRPLSRKAWKAKVTGFTSAGGAEAYTDVPILAISGTHERLAEGKDNVLKLLALAGLLVDVSEATAIVEAGGERTAVCGLGGVPEEHARDVIRRLAPKAVDGAFSVFMLHQTLKEVLPFGENILEFDDLPDGFDLYIDGHIHSRVEAKAKGKPFLIPGSTVLTQLKDAEQEKKGFIVFDTKTSTHSFMDISSRDFFAIKVGMDGCTPADVVRKVEEGVEGAIRKGKEKPIVKVFVTGSLQKGYSAADMPLREIALRYSEKGTVEIDASKLKVPDLQTGIEEVRGEGAGGMTIKELGARALSDALNANGFDRNSVDAARLFDILSSLAKENAIREASAMLDAN